MYSFLNASVKRVFKCFYELQRKIDKELDLETGWLVIPVCPRFSWFKHRESHILGNPLFLDQLEWLVTLLEGQVAMRMRTGDKWLHVWLMITETLMPSISRVHSVTEAVAPEPYPAPPLNGNQLLLPKCQEEPTKRKTRIGCNQWQKIWLPVDLDLHYTLTVIAC